MATTTLLHARPKARHLPRPSLLTAAEPQEVTQVYAVDHFGEVAGRKRTAEAKARKLGHTLTGWHRRDDPAGRWNNFCATCARLVVVCTEPPHGLPFIYGHAVTDRCAG